MIILTLMSISSYTLSYTNGYQSIPTTSILFSRFFISGSLSKKKTPPRPSKQTLQTNHVNCFGFLLLVSVACVYLLVFL